MKSSACPHVSPRLDGALLGPCDACAAPRESAGLTVIYHGGGERNNRQAFHDRTIGEAIRETTEKNPDARHVGSRWV